MINKKLLFLMSTFACITVNAQENTANTNEKIIKAGSHTQQQKILYQKYCGAIGGVDITDNSDINLGPNTVDAIFCKITDENKFAKTIPYATSGSINSDGSLQLSNNIDSDMVTSLSKLNKLGTYSAQAANGTVSMYTNWYTTGIGYYNNVNAQSSIKEEVPTFGCFATNEAYVGSGNLTATAICGPSQGITSTYNYATACVNGAGCVQSKGTIYFSK
jgi:hypothetical protein